MFCEERESGVESGGCGGGGFKSAQVFRNEWFADRLKAVGFGKSAKAVRNEDGGKPAGVRDSNRRGEFTEECSTGEGTCQ